MRKQHLVIYVVISFLVGFASPAGAISYRVTMDVSGLAGNDLELEIALYDNSGVIGDSYALIDNLFFGAVAEDFETGGLGGFDSSLNPASVNAIFGNMDGTGGYVLRIDEDPAFTPTLTWRDFTGSAAMTLSFDFRFVGDAGGTDELVFSLLDPATLDPLLAGLTPGFGDILAVRTGGTVYTDAVMLTPIDDIIPEPITLLGLGLGLGGLNHYFRKRP